jgi:hypothetical protein
MAVELLVLPQLSVSTRYSAMGSLASLPQHHHSAAADALATHNALTIFCISA